jgi:hypothetical protein
VSNANRYGISTGGSYNVANSVGFKRRIFNATDGKCEPRLHCVLTKFMQTQPRKSSIISYPLTINIHRCSSPDDSKKYSKDYCCPNNERCLPTNNGVETLYFKVKIIFYYASVFIKIYLFYLDSLV